MSLIQDTFLSLGWRRQHGKNVEDHNKTGENSWNVDETCQNGKMVLGLLCDETPTATLTLSHDRGAGRLMLRSRPLDAGDRGQLDTTGASSYGKLTDACPRGFLSFPSLGKPCRLPIRKFSIRARSQGHLEQLRNESFAYLALV